MNSLDTAVSTLAQHIKEIQTVSEWAELMGFTSEKYFSRTIRNTYGKRPKELMIEIRLELIRECLRKTENEIFYCIAKDLGFANDASLYKFIKRHTGMTPTELKRECKKGV